MLKSLRNVFKVKDIRRKLFYLVVMIFVIRLGSEIPVPGVDGDYFKQWFESQSGDAFNFFDAFTGGSFTQMSIFALNITPYITASIIIQLLTIFESVAMAIGFGRQGLIPIMSSGSDASGFEKFAAGAVVVVCLTAGSAMLMWIGERITEKKVGNGMSIVLTINIVSRMPSDFATLYDTFVKGKTIAKGTLAALIIIAIVLVVVVFVLILNGAQRKIPVQYSKKMQGRKMVGGQSSFIPLKVNTAGVIPIIFASSIMSMPVMIATFAGKSNMGGIGGEILHGLSSSNWCNPDEPIYSIGLVVYVALCIFFAYFYTSITFNPLEIADNMKKQGGFIPGIRPGKPTSEYLTKILNYIIFIGAVGLVIVSVIPFFFNGVFGANVSFFLSSSSCG